MKNSIIFILLFFVCFICHGNDSTKVKPVEVRVLPVVGFTPETSWAFGVVTPIILNKQTDSSSYRRLSYVQPFLVYTLKNQYLFNNRLDFYFKRTFLLESFFLLARFPNPYYGVGNETLLDDEENINMRFYQAKLNIFKVFKERFFVGVSSELNRFNPSYKNMSSFTKNNLEGYNGGSMWGVGLACRYDTRDNTAFATQGEFIELINHNFIDFTFTDYGYSHLQLTGKKFFKISDKYSVGTATTFVTNVGGKVPFYLKEYIGGSNRMRGIYATRFIEDHSFYSIQELRRAIGKRFHAVVFSSFGSVSHSQAQIFNHLKFAFGVGGRYQLTKKQRLNLRLDVAKSVFGTGFYLSIGEAF